MLSFPVDRNVKLVTSLREVGLPWVASSEWEPSYHEQVSSRKNSPVSLILFEKGSQYVAQAGLELMAIFLPQSFRILRLHLSVNITPGQVGT